MLNVLFPRWNVMIGNGVWRSNCEGLLSDVLIIQHTDCTIVWHFFAEFDSVLWES